MSKPKRSIKPLFNRGGKLCIAVLVLAMISTQALNIKSVYADDGGYPWIGATQLKPTPNYTSDYGYYPSCPASDNQCFNGGSSLLYTDSNGHTWGEADLWHYGLRNCTSYVAWKENQVLSADIHGWGDAKDWATNAPASEVHPASKYTPVAGDIAQWNYSSSDTFGHVAYVSSVVGGTVNLWDYNVAWDGLFYSNYTTATEPNGAPNNYIHVGVLSGSPGSVGSATYTGGDSMASASTMNTNYYLTSQNVQHALVFQTDGNLVLYNNGAALWSSNTGGQGGTHLDMQADGNLVIYNSDRSTWLWQSNTGGHLGANAYAKLQSDGNFVVYTSSGTPLWWTGTGGHPNLSYFGSDRLHGNSTCGSLSGQCIIQGQYLRSPDGRYALLMQSDGNAVFYSPGYHILWQSATVGAGDTFIMQADGNLVLSSGGAAQWWTGTSGSNNYAVIQSDGNFVVYSSTNAVLWSSGTYNKI